MRVLLDSDAEARSMNILTYGCVCHALNNFGKDIVKLGSVQKLLEQAKVVAAVFRNVKFCKYHLNQTQRQLHNKTLQLLMPVDTRWNSNVAMLESIQRSKEALRQVSLKDKFGELDPRIDLRNQFSGSNTAREDGAQISAADLIESVSFWKRLDEAILLLKPVATLVTYLENDVTPISMLAAAFIKLLRLFKKTAALDDSAFPFADIGLKTSDFIDKKEHKAKTLPDLLRRRWNEVTAHTVNPENPGTISGLFQLALYLDVGVRDLVVLAQQEEIQLDAGRPVAEAVCNGAKWLCDHILALPGSEHFAEKLSGAPVLVEISLFQRIQSAVNFEASPPGGLQHPLRYYALQFNPEAIMAKNLFSFPTSAAGGERSFNVYDSKHTKKRNRIENKKLDALVKVTMNRKQLARKMVVWTTERQNDTIAFFFSAEYALRTICTTATSETSEEDEEDTEANLRENEAPGGMAKSSGMATDNFPAVVDLASGSDSNSGMAIDNCPPVVGLASGSDDEEFTRAVDCIERKMNTLGDIEVPGAHSLRLSAAARLNKIGEESFVEGNTMDSLMDMSAVNADSHLRVFPTSFSNWLVYDKDENVWLIKFQREISKYTRKAIPRTLARADEVRRFFVPCNIDNAHWWLLEIDMDEKRLLIHESLKSNPGDKTTVIDRVCQCLKHVYDNKIDFDTFPVTTVVENVQSSAQTDQHDCAFFVLEKIKFAKAGRPLSSVNQATATARRKRTICDIAEVLRGMSENNQ